MTAKKVAIQIVHCTQRNRWVTASMKWCTNCDVKVNDSVFNKLDKNTLEILTEMFGPIVDVINTQKQLGTDDRGLFAIAYTWFQLLMKKIQKWSSMIKNCLGHTLQVVLLVES